jgi:hypothetical protein
MAGRIDSDKQTEPEARCSDASGLFAFGVDPVTHTVRITFEPWVPVFIAIMVKFGRSDTYRGTLSSFVLDHGVVVQ